MPTPFPVTGPVRRLLVLAFILTVAGPGADGTLAVAATAAPAVTPPPPIAKGPDSAPAAWPAGLYNPQPLPDDLIVPLPCGGALAFRPVATPAGSTRTGLVGPFTGSGEGAEHHLLIGKYEVTALQYLSVTTAGAGRPCPAASALAGSAARAAQVGVSRIDAVNFAAQLSRWLHANAARIPPCDTGDAPCLPRVDGKPAFVRLPQESEWEYAARGGAMVPDAIFARSRYPMPEGLGRHAWYNRNADGEIAPIGQRLPNPLGLYDLYGNAWEFMNEAYRSAQFPGQIGGDVLRGGGIHSADDELRADGRVEVQPYDAAGEVGTADTGFRVVLAAPVVTSMAKRDAGAGEIERTDRTQRTDDRASRPAPPVPVVLDGHLRIQVDAVGTNPFVDVDGAMKGLVIGGRSLDVTGLARGTHDIKVRVGPGHGYPDEVRTQVQITGAEPVEVRIHLEPTPERAEDLLRLTPIERQVIADQLSRLGWLCRLTQGLFDSGCRNALKALQRQGELPATGYLTAATRTLIEQRIEERNLQQQSARHGVQGSGVTSPPPSDRYIPFIGQRDEGIVMDPVLPP